MIPHKIKIKIIQTLIEPDTLKATKSIWGRELKLLKQIADIKYDDGAFWLTLKLGYLVNSFAFFKTERGAMELEQAWRQYKMDKEIQKTLDTSAKSYSIDLLNQQSVEPLPTKETMVNWADSI